jgi:hypothetical protein
MLRHENAWSVVSAVVPAVGGAEEWGVFGLTCRCQALTCSFGPLALGRIGTHLVPIRVSLVVRGHERLVRVAAGSTV